MPYGVYGRCNGRYYSWLCWCHVCLTPPFCSGGEQGGGARNGGCGGSPCMKQVKEQGRDVVTFVLAADCGKNGLLRPFCLIFVDSPVGRVGGCEGFRVGSVCVSPRRMRPRAWCRVVPDRYALSAQMKNGRVAGPGRFSRNDLSQVVAIAGGWTLCTCCPRSRIC